MSSQYQDTIPRLLLVEDDPISQGFLEAALESLPARVDVADSLASALQRASTRRHDLWLIDVNLPDGTGPQLLQQLRTHHPGVPALAHTADGSLEIAQSLAQDGFNEILLKPLSSTLLLKAVRRALARGNDSQSATLESAVSDWDETAALAALNGQRANLLALRELFMTELPGARDAVRSALQCKDNAALCGQLHRLQASCGFVGASRLGRAVRQLHQDPGSDTAQNQFSAAVAALLN